MRMHIMGAVPLPDDDLLTAGEAARLAQVSIDTVRRWGEAGKIPMTRTPTGNRRFRRSDVEALLVPITPEAAEA